MGTKVWTKNELKCTGFDDVAVIIQMILYDRCQRNTDVSSGVIGNTA